MVRASWLAPVLVLACTRPSPPAPDPTPVTPLAPAPVDSAEIATASASAVVTPSASASAVPAAPGAQCTGRSELTTNAGAKVSCYPFRCRGGVCLRSCSSAEDCSGSRGPAELATEGWPLECLGGSCVPMPRWKVDGKHP